MARLRDPERGCPWDLQQTFASIVPHTLEEAYEVADAIAGGDPSEIRDELGDLLFQVVFYAQIALEDPAHGYGFDAIADCTAQKMIDRHPHIFGDVTVVDAVTMTTMWERDKTAVRAAKAQAAGRIASVFDGLPLALPALTRALKLQQRAARVRFDWTSLEPVLAKVWEELDELSHEIQRDASNDDRLEDELGDVLFAVSNLARHLNIDPEAALRRTNDKFMRRFRAIETMYHGRGEAIEEASLDALEAAWRAIKAQE
jgi:MazG family protein